MQKKAPSGQSCVRSPTTCTHVHSDVTMTSHNDVTMTSQRRHHDVTERQVDDEVVGGGAHVSFAPDDEDDRIRQVAPPMKTTVALPNNDVTMITTQTDTCRSIQATYTKIGVKFGHAVFELRQTNKQTNKRQTDILITVLRTPPGGSKDRILIHDLLFLPISTIESAVGKRLITHCCISRVACSRLSGHIEPHSP